MAHNDLNEYRRDIGAKVVRITEVLDHIANNDFSKRVEIGIDDGDGFGEMSRRLNQLVEDLEKVNRERDEQALANELRSRMWRHASDESLDEEQLIRKLIETVGPALRVSRAAFSRLYRERGEGVCEVLWCGEGVEGHLGATFPSSVISHLLNKPYLVLSLSTIPETARATVEPFLERFAVDSCVVVPYGDPEEPEGILTIDSCTHEREWTQAEIGIFMEVVRIAKVRADQIKAHNERRLVNEELERKVAEQTAHLETANHKLQQDIVELKLAEEAIKESEEKFRAVAEGAHEAIISTDCIGGIVFWNRGAEVMYGYGAQEIVGKRADLLVPNSYRAAFMVKLEEMAAGDSSLLGRTIEMEGLRKDGSTFPVELSVSPWKSRDRQFFTAVVRNITERKKAERALAEEKRLLDVTLGSIADGVITVDASGKILLLNSAASSLTGWSQADALGKDLQEVLHLLNPRNMAYRESPYRRVLRTGHLHGPIEALVVAADGAEHNVTVIGAPIRDTDNGIVGVVLAFRDITEKQRMEEELF
ncbi:MAG: PAS domain S-box protein, partial [Chitinivibrionales bacterium]|nr:PAS domain S-box protein [Chitinivibrionales bacterium]MBD3358829.1 PAS domain S-box protein [Chitinivibrionales bacterium]